MGGPEAYVWAVGGGLPGVGGFGTQPGSPGRGTGFGSLQAGVRVGENSNGRWRGLLLGAGLGLVALAVVLSVGASYRLYDPVQIWSVKGYGIAAAASILGGAALGGPWPFLPLNIPMQVALFFLADGDALPGSKFLYPIYGFALCACVYAFLRRREVDERIAGLGAIFLGTVPIFFFHATSGFANLPFTSFSSLGRSGG